MEWFSEVVQAVYDLCRQLHICHICNNDNVGILDIFSLSDYIKLSTFVNALYAYDICLNCPFFYFWDRIAAKPFGLTSTTVLLQRLGCNSTLLQH